MKANVQTRARDTVSSGREKAAGVLDRAGTMIRDRSHRAARLVERGGARAAETVEHQAERVNPNGRPKARVRNYVSTHPRRFFIAAGLLTLVLTLLLIRARAGADLDEDDF